MPDVPRIPDHQRAYSHAMVTLVIHSQYRPMVQNRRHQSLSNHAIQEMADGLCTPEATIPNHAILATVDLAYTTAKVNRSHAILATVDLAYTAARLNRGHATMERTG
jgi:hypothetical protein